MFFANGFGFVEGIEDIEDGIEFHDADHLEEAFVDVAEFDAAAVCFDAAVDLHEDANTDAGHAVEMLAVNDDVFHVFADLAIELGGEFLSSPSINFALDRDKNAAAIELFGLNFHPLPFGRIL